MSKKQMFDLKKIELDMSVKWESEGLYELSRSCTKKSESFCIQLPPPNVTGTLHMGHAFNQTLMDILTRWQRMKQKTTLWLPGTDHAGIATQMVVERQLSQRGNSKNQIGRKAFLDEIWKWKQESGETITKQMRRLGSSCDWSREYFTMDESRSKVVERVFCELYNQGLIYKGKRLVNWDPVLKTAVSDLEVINEDKKGFIWKIRYPLFNKKGMHPSPSQINIENQYLTVATTRPETLIGDVAVAVHPDDKRYERLIGLFLKVPITGRTIPIISDKSVDMEFGTGCVKITPAHDFNDYEIGLRHNLPLINIFTLDARINEQGPKSYIGLDRFEAREKILVDLRNLGFLQAENTHDLVIKKGDRSGTIIEPLLTDQWFVAMNKSAVSGGKKNGESLSQQGLEMLNTGKVKLFPEAWNSTYKNWLQNLQDWCISRQLWWGHQIPAWYKSDEFGEAILDGVVFVASSESNAKKQAVEKGWNGPIIRDPDVLDTWFSSALIPFSSLVNKDQVWDEKSNLPNLNQDLKSFLPSEVLVTGFDIIFFWVARMVMMTSHIFDTVPFKNVYIHALVRDADGNKMSKSRGNTLDPIDLIDGIELEDLIKKRCFGLMNPKQALRIEKKTRSEFPKGINSFGTDALRFTFANLASPGRDINFDMSRCEGYRNFCNKLRNASRFVMLNCKDTDNGLDKCTGSCGSDGYLYFSNSDKWIVTRLNESIKNIDNLLSKFRFDLAAKELYEFVWNEFCDWYLEIAKTQLKSGLDNRKRATRRTMLRTLETILRLSHPFVPFLTEELWQSVAPAAGRFYKSETNKFNSIMISNFPEFDSSKIDSLSSNKIAQLKKVVSIVRTLRSEMGLSPSKKTPLLIKHNKSIKKTDDLLLDFSNISDETNDYFSIIKSLAKVSEVKVVDSVPKELLNSPFKLIENLKLILNVSVDPELEKQRIRKEIEKYEVEVEKASNKLSNVSFVEKAPASIVNQERERLRSFNEKVKKLKDQITIFE